MMYYHSYDDDDVFIVTTSLWGFEEKVVKKKDKPNISHPPHGKGNIVFQTFGWERLDVTRMEKHHGHHKVRGNKIPHGGKLTPLLARYSLCFRGVNPFSNLPKLDLQRIALRRLRASCCISCSSVSNTFVPRRESYF